MVLVVLVSLDGVVVDQVEQGREAHSSLDEGGESTVFGKTILMIPSPVCSGKTSGNSSGAHVPP